MIQEYEELYDLVNEINLKHNLEIELDNIVDTYGEDVIELIAEDLDAFEEKIEWLLSLGFSDTVSDICRYGILFAEDNNLFISKFSELIQRLGNDYVDEISEDLSLLEEVLL